MYLIKLQNLPSRYAVFHMQIVMKSSQRIKTVCALDDAKRRFRSKQFFSNFPTIVNKLEVRWR